MMTNRCYESTPTNYWSEKLDDAEEQGYIDGWSDADKSRPMRISTIFAVGLTIGLLIGFFLFHK
jgi:F0F1-type ATP synthase assembly protein I